MKFLKLLVKIIVAILVLFIIAFIVVKIVYSEKLPEGTKGPEAEQLTQRMLSAINKDAWDTIPYVQWSFRDEHHYVWDKQNNEARVIWDEYEVHLDLDQVHGKAYENGVELSDGAKAKSISTAWSYWCNDSFWFYAPAKIYDPGTSRSAVDLEDGSKGLLITYESGGVTPGDSYLWVMDDSGLPEYWKMWTKIIPIGGVKTTWEDWVTLPGGAKVASIHKAGGLTLELTNIAGGYSWDQLGFENDPINP